MNNQTRRQFLKKSIITSASIALASQAHSSLLNSNNSVSINDLEPSDKFTMGVAAGDVTNSQALLWTQYDGVFPLKLILWHQEKPLEPLLFIDVQKSYGNYVHVNVEGLQARHKYQYAFVEVDFNQKPLFKSQIGNFLVAPNANDLVPVTLGAVSCTYKWFEPTILEHAGKRNDLDFFLLLGDTSYNDDAETLEDFRSMWTHTLKKEGYLSLRSSTSVLATLDDHEICNNFDPETIDPQIYQAALQAFFEHQPIRRQEKNPERIWRKFRWGRTVEVFVLDCRTERKPSTRQYKHAQYISKEQMNWLKNSLSQSDAVFKVIVNSVPISTFPFFSESDRWEGYPSQREEILNFIDNENIPGVLWVAGDFHFASVGKVSKKGPGSKQQEILVGPGAQIPNFACLPLNLSSQFEWASARNNYVTLKFDPYKLHVDLVYQGGSEDPALTRLDEITEIYRTRLKLGK